MTDSQHVRSAAALYAPAIAETPPADAYLESMARDGTWGDELTLRALSDALGLVINVITSDFRNWYLQYLPSHEEVGGCAAEWLSGTIRDIMTLLAHKALHSAGSLAPPSSRRAPTCSSPTSPPSTTTPSGAKSHWRARSPLARLTKRRSSLRLGSWFPAVPAGATAAGERACPS